MAKLNVAPMKFMSRLLVPGMVQLFVLLALVPGSSAVPSPSILASLSRTLRGDLNHGRTPLPGSSVRTSSLAPQNTDQIVAYDRLTKNTTHDSGYRIVTVIGAAGLGGQSAAPPPTSIPSVRYPGGREPRPEPTCSRQPRNTVVRFRGCLSVTLDIGSCKGSCLHGGDFLKGNLTAGSDGVYRFPTTSSRHCKCCKIAAREVRYFEFLCAPPPGYQGSNAMVRSFVKIEVVSGCRCQRCFFKRRS